MLDLNGRGLIFIRIRQGRFIEPNCELNLIAFDSHRLTGDRLIVLVVPGNHFWHQARLGIAGGPDFERRLFDGWNF